MQEAKDQMQRRGSLSALWQVDFAVFICAQLLLQWFQGLGVNHHTLPRQDASNTYAREFRVMTANIQALQEQVDSLYASLSALRTTPENNGPLQPGHGSYPRPPSPSRPTSRSSFQNSMSPSQPRGKHPRFQGPTSSAFNFDVANSSLQTMGITEADLPGEEALNYEETPLNSPPQQQSVVTSIFAPPPAKDPIWKVGKEEAIRLCRVYEEEIGITYPMLDIEKTIERAHLLFTSNESATRTGLMKGLPGLENLDPDEINIIKTILATTLTVEGSGQSELGRMLFDSVRETSESKLWEPVEIRGLILLALVVWASACYVLL